MLFFLEQLQLQSAMFRGSFLLSNKDFHIPKLLVGNANDSYFSFVGNKFLYSTDVYLHIFFTGTMPDIDGELKHCKSIFNKVFSKKGMLPPFPFCLCWEIKENHYPHDSIFAKTVHIYSSGYEIFLISPSKHFARLAVVVEAAIIKGFLFPSITTSRTGMDNNFAFTDVDRCV